MDLLWTAWVDPLLWVAVVTILLTGMDLLVMGPLTAGTLAMCAI